MPIDREVVSINQFEILQKWGGPISLVVAPGRCDPVKPILFLIGLLSWKYSSNEFGEFPIYSKVEKHTPHIIMGTIITCYGHRYYGVCVIYSSKLMVTH